jgi:hypothetical protein
MGCSDSKYSLNTKEKENDNFNSKDNDEKIEKMDLSEDNSEGSEKEKGNENGKLYLIIIYIKRKFN